MNTRRKGRCTLRELQDQSDLLGYMSNPYQLDDQLKHNLEVEFRLWDGRIVVARNFQDQDVIIDFRTPKSSIPRIILEDFVETLLEDEISFIIGCGLDDQRRTIIWELRKA